MKATIKTIGEYEGQTVTIGCWLANKRSSGKIAFLQLRDGTGYIQGVVAKDEIGETGFQQAREIGQESSLYVTGEVRADERAPSGYELTVHDVDIIQDTKDYPITPKEHGTEFLMDHRHLWIRSSRQHAILRIRDVIIQATYRFFKAHGFTKVDPPILTANSAEGTTNLFHTKYFDEDAFLSQSGQLYLEAAALAFKRVFSFGPTFRAEKSKTRRHLIEFWMIEPEMAFCDHEESLEIQEAYVVAITQAVLEEAKAELQTLGRNLAPLENIQAPFPRMRYDEAIERLQREGFDISWGEDLGAPHETEIANQFDKPVFITHYPQAIKAFYMKPEPGNPDVALCADLIAPEGYGEIIGGSERIDDYDLLAERFREYQLSEEAYQWYLELRQYGSVPHSGFGLGLERTVAWMSGTEHVRETIPFPRLLNRLYP